MKTDFAKDDSRIDDKSSLLPGKTIKERIKEHLRQREKDRKKQTRKGAFIATSAKPRIAQTLKPSKRPRKGRTQSSSVEVNGVQLYSVEEWLRMG